MAIAMKENEERVENTTTPEDAEFLGYYGKVRDELLFLVREQESTIVRTNHTMGYKILEACRYLQTKAEIEGSGIRKGDIGRLMDNLAQDLGRSQSTLYDCKMFAEKCPDWNDFANRKFLLTRRNSNALESSVQVLGQNMSWREVLQNVLRNPQETEQSKDKAPKPEKHTINVTSPEQVFVVPLSKEELQRFRQLALQEGKLPDEIVADAIRKYIQWMENKTQARS